MKWDSPTAATPFMLAATLILVASLTVSTRAWTQEKTDTEVPTPPPSTVEPCIGKPLTYIITFDRFTEREHSE
jgi:hypothetical protein